MSFSPSFGSQVAAIMDVLAKAAVAEITKLMADESLVLKLEMCRRDTEIQDLKRSLDLMEVQLCKAQQAATTRITAGWQETGSGSQTSSEDRKEDQQTCAAYLEPKAADSCDVEEKSGDMRPVVKHEPEDKPAAEESIATAANNVCFEGAEHDAPIWPPVACGLFEESSVSGQQIIQVFPSHAEQFPAHRNTEASYGSSSAAVEQKAEDCLNVPVKVEVENPHMCVESVASESVHIEPFRQDLCREFSQGRSSPALQKSAEDSHVLVRNNLRAKRSVNPWRVNQRVFTCCVCSKAFPRMSQLEEHNSMHQPFKPFRCLECGKSFTQKTRLKTHQSVHTGERPFSCKICGKMFSRQDNCMRHERFHSGSKPYSCGQCGKSFTVLANLKIHKEIHLQEK
ncbi:zinc finger protein 569-like [Echeneis naucrates]|uniref:zinc finger protein 569-like n=1 Tax=Echeneis naucrates TaxID=173247 RepID=UPI0011142FD3|nr:zinc finger protein 569-like [Echeneis naucrates]